MVDRGKRKMTTRILNAILIPTAGALLFGALFAYLHKNEVQAIITTPRGELIVTLAENKAAWEQGLSGTASLKPHTGKLFIFDKADLYGFWMKDMHYPIDIVWIDEAQTVVGVREHVVPESYPEVFYPPTPVRYVLEVNAGEVAIEQLVSGVHIDIVRPSKK